MSTIMVRSSRRSLVSWHDRYDTRSFTVEALERRELLATVTLEPSRDVTIFQQPEGSLANGAGEYLFLGRSKQGAQSDLEIRRAVVYFDIASRIPAGSTITSATLEVNVSKTITNATSATLHRVSKNWSEGSSNATGEEGAGIAAKNGDTTWLHSQFPSVTWTTPGGDFDASASATTALARRGKYVWTSGQLAADVQQWLNNSATNFGWLMKGDESASGTAKRIDSRENATSSNRPHLTIEYDAPVPVPTIAISGTSAVEGNDGSKSFQFTVTLSAAPTQNVSVNYATIAGTATAGDDYVPSSGSLTFAPTDPLTKPITVQVQGDSVFESDESFQVKLSDAQQATLTTAQATGTITNDDATPQLTSNDLDVTETATASVAVLEVSLTNPSDQPITVDFAIEADTAVAPSDFETKSGTLSFAPGATSRTLSITIVGDQVAEPSERFRVRLSNPVQATIASGKDLINVTIADDDATATHPWQNSPLAEDVNDSGEVSPIDALLVINYLNEIGGGALPVPPAAPNVPPPFYDVSGDDFVSPLDALLVINVLNSQSDVEAARPIARDVLTDVALALAFDEDALDRIEWL